MQKNFIPGRSSKYVIFKDVNDVAYNKVIFCRLNNVQDSSNNSKFIKNNLEKDIKQLENWSGKWLHEFILAKQNYEFYRPKRFTNILFWILQLPHWICVKQSHLNNFLCKLKMNNIHEHYAMSLSNMSVPLISRISTLLFSFKIYLNRLFLVMTIYKHWTKNL